MDWVRVTDYGAEKAHHGVVTTPFRGGMKSAIFCISAHMFV